MTHTIDLSALQGRYSTLLASSGALDRHKRLEHVLIINDVGNSSSAFYVVHGTKNYLFETLEIAVDFYNYLNSL